MSAPGRALPLVVFVIDGQRYGLRVAAVERVLPMVAVSPLPKAPPIAIGVINVRGRVVPVVDVRRRLGFRPRDWGVGAHLLLARARGRTLALPVDEVQGVTEVAAEAVTEPGAVLAGIGHVAGIVALADGLLLIQDLDAFLSLDEERALTEALGGARP